MVVRWRWRAALAVLIVAQLLSGLTVRTAATDAVDRGEAAGDAYALLVRGLTGPTTSSIPDGYGPMALARAQAPPSPTASRRSGTLLCGAPATSSCPVPALRSLQVTDDVAVATLTGGTRGCRIPATVGGIDPPLAPPAAIACDTIAHVEVSLGGVDVVADAVSSRSLVQGCSRPVGGAAVNSVRVAGLPAVAAMLPSVPGGVSEVDHTVVIPPGATAGAVMATLVVDEQIPDPGGGGLTVNALHLHGGPALGAAANLDVVIGHTHSQVVCPRLTLQREIVPTGEVTYAVVDPAIFPVDAAVVGDGARSCFAGNRRGNGCMEPLATLLLRRHGLLGVTANYTDWIHVLGAAIVDHHAWAPVDPHTTSLCVGDGGGGVPLVRIVKTADASECRIAVSGQRIVTGGRPDVEGLSDAGHHGRFWWSTRPSVAEPRALAGVRADGTVVIALATATRGGVEGGLTQPDAVRWMVDHGVVDAIEMDGGGQGDMVVAGGGHVVPLQSEVPRMQVALLLDAPGSEAVP